MSCLAVFFPVPIMELYEPVHNKSILIVIVFFLIFIVIELFEIKSGLPEFLLDKTQTASGTVQHSPSYGSPR